GHNKVLKLLSALAGLLYPEKRYQTFLSVTAGVLPSQAKHTGQHEGRHYSIPLEEVKAVFPHGLPYRFQQQVLCLGTHPVPPNSYNYFYFKKNTKQTFILLTAHLWVKNCRELMKSSYKEERLDQPLQASVWLKNFKASNERFLKEIKTQKTYVWGKQESTEEGRPLGEVVEQGLARTRNASDAVGVVLKELKQQCQRGSFRLLVAVDGVNALWGRTTLKREDKSPVSPEDLTLVYNLRKMMMNNWNGGAIVTTLSQTGSLFKPSSAYLPQELLGKEGFDALDPFVPIPVPNYSPREFESCYHYYLDCKWLQHEQARTEAGKEELRFLSGSNPRQLERLAGPL
uniref:Small ribosomal subunit protein mS29 n=1 Tax=Athene cunicularia TaxID=194338 RepID=A0A663M791_ATHCN